MRILIIDDEPDLLECICDSISMKYPDLEVLSATGVIKAKEKISKADIILSDINMPLRQELEDMLSICGKPVARITGHDDLKSDLVVYKPYTDEKLYKVIDMLIAMHKKIVR